MAPNRGAANLSAVQEELDLLIRSRYPLLYLTTWEEERVIRILSDIAGQREKVLCVWSSTEGLRKVGDRKEAADELARDPLNLLEKIQKSPDRVIFLLLDFHPFLTDHTVVRMLRETAWALRDSFKTIVISAPLVRIPPELEKEMTLLDFPLPTFADIKQVLDELMASVRQNPRVTINLSPDGEEQLVKAALGLTASEAERVFAKVLVKDATLDEQDILLVIAEKEQVIKKSGILEYYRAEEKFGQIGGLENLKTWLKKRSGAFSEKARAFGLPEPKGILLMGVQGCGKSLAAKAIASLWSLPMLRLDVGNVFSGMVGSSEENIRKAIRTAESIAPCILWMDEIEKGFSGIASSNVSDAGTLARVFGTFITWLQEKKAPVFVVATANEVSLLPPELLRKGRFDEIFFVDLPNRRERREIFEIHLRKRSRNPSAFPLDDLALRSEGWSGAEIEQAVVSGLYDAYEENRDLDANDLKRNLAAMVPLSTTMKEAIEEVRAWAKTRARPASRPEAGEAPARTVAHALEMNA